MVKTKDNVVKLDDTDINILKIINEDVRTSYRQISRSLDVSVGTVHNRIDKMVKSGVICIDHNHRCKSKRRKTQKLGRKNIFQQKCCWNIRRYWRI